MKITKENIKDFLPKSKLTRDQGGNATKVINSKVFIVYLRYDDRCKNGHNTFSITGEYDNFFGCIHESIAEHFPELKYLLKWHLVSSDGPMYYIENTKYHATKADLKAARECALWPKATKKDLLNEQKLLDRLPTVMKRFKADMEKIGFVY